MNAPERNFDKRLKKLEKSLEDCNSAILTMKDVRVTATFKEAEPEPLIQGYIYMMSGELTRYNKRMDISMVTIKPATLDDLSINIGEVECWFVRDSADTLYLYDRIFVGESRSWLEEPIDSFLKPLRELAELKHARVICESQWRVILEAAGKTIECNTIYQ